MGQMSRHGKLPSVAVSTRSTCGMRLLLSTVLLPLQSLVFSPGLLLEETFHSGLAQESLIAIGIGFLPCASKCSAKHLQILDLIYKSYG